MNHKRKHLLLAGMISLSVSGMTSADEQASADKHMSDPDSMIRASDILNADISNGMDVIGGVNDVILDENSESVEYVLFNVSETFSPTMENREAFAETDNVDFSKANVSADWRVVIEDTDAQKKPEELMVSRKNADHRLLSKVLDSHLYFPGDETRELSDVLVDPETGEIAYYTVEMNDESFFIFDREIRVISADEVNIGMNGRLSTEASMSEVDSDNQYQLSSL